MNSRICAHEEERNVLEMFVKNTYVTIQSVLLTKSTDEDQDLVPGRCTAVAPQKRMGRTQTTNFIVCHVYVTNKVAYLLL